MLCMLCKFKILIHLDILVVSLFRYVTGLDLHNELRFMFY